MKVAVLFIVLITLAISVAAQEKPEDKSEFPVMTGPFLGQNPPGIKLELFASGVVSLPGSNEFYASFSPDGKEFYFNRGMKIMVSTLENGQWSAPKRTSFSAGYRAHEAHVTFDNKRVFWGWFKDDEYAIYYCDRTQGGWSDARHAGMAEKGMCVSSDRNGELFITKSELGEIPVIANVIMKDGKFIEMIPLKGKINETKGVENTRGFRNMSHPGVSPDGSYVIFDCNGGSHPWVSFRQKDGTWGEGVDLTEYGIGAEYGAATVSRDGKYIFFSGNDDIYWVSSKIIEDLKPDDSD